MDTINYFIAESDLPEQTTDQAFGVTASGQYNVTSRFIGGSNPMAYAVTSGSIFIVNQDNNINRVNLFLLPDGLLFGTPVKYFIYRGLLKSDFLDQGNSYIGIRTSDQDDSQFIVNLRKAMNGASALNLFPDLTDDYYIDNLFANDQYQFGLVSQGDSIGRFDSAIEFGFEIMLDEPFFAPTLGDARTDVNIIDSSDEDDPNVARVQVLNYIDPAAFYGLFAHSAFTVGSNETTVPTSRTKDQLYTFISQFFTKNSIYIDIRDEYDNPIDWFADSPQTIKLTTDNTSAVVSAEVSYRASDQFPLKILSTGFSAVQTSAIGQKYFTLTLSLPTQMITTPLLILQTGYWLKFVTSLQDNLLFSACTPVNGWSEDKIFTIFSAVDEDGDVQMASYLRLTLGTYCDMEAINDQIINPNEIDNNGDGDDEDDSILFYNVGLFPFHTEGLPDYPTN